MKSQSVELIDVKTINLANGCKVEYKALAYKTMSVPVYYGYTSSGHFVGYSNKLSTITKRIEKKG